MKSLLAVGIASIYGLALHTLFGFFPDVMNIMGGTFLILVPFLIGFITVWIYTINRKVNYTGAFFLPWATSLALLIITIAIEVEGAICWVMIFPMFAIASGIGGCICLAIRKGQWSKEDERRKKNHIQISVAMVVVPLLLGLAEGDRLQVAKVNSVTATKTIDASRAQVWEAITQLSIKSPPSTNAVFAGILGFPAHTHTTLDKVAVGGKRVAHYERGLYFSEEIISLQPEEQLTLRVDTDPESIPPTVMDEHILIGGEYFDITEDQYDLEALGNGKTKVTLQSTFSINTPFNWYSEWWAKFLLEDTIEHELEKLEARSTQ